MLCWRRRHASSTSDSSCLPKTSRAKALELFMCSGALRPAAMRDWPVFSQSCRADRPRKANLKNSIDQANREALRRIVDGEPVLVDVVAARDAIPELADYVI